MADDPNARESVAVVERAREAPVEPARSPWWYYPASGLVLGAGTGAMLWWSPGVLAGIAVLAMVIAINLLEFARRRVTGVRVSEFGRGRATVYAVAGGILCLGVLALGMFLVFGQHRTWAAWAAAVAIFVLVVASGAAFERASRRRSHRPA